MNFLQWLVQWWIKGEVKIPMQCFPLDSLVFWQNADIAKTFWKVVKVFMKISKLFNKVELIKLNKILSFYHYFNRVN